MKLYQDVCQYKMSALDQQLLVTCHIEMSLALPGTRLAISRVKWDSPVLMLVVEWCVGSRGVGQRITRASVPDRDLYKRGAGDTARVSWNS